MNHVIDPTYFYDALKQFSFKYNIYHTKGLTIDELGMQHYIYEYDHIIGSLQSQGHSRQKKEDGNVDTWDYSFYCKSLYRIDIGDIIEYRDKFLCVTSITDYDEWGVREAKLTMIELAAYKDFAEYLRFLNKEEMI